MIYKDKDATKKFEMKECHKQNENDNKLWTKI